MLHVYRLLFNGIYEICGNVWEIWPATCGCRISFCFVKARLPWLKLEKSSDFWREYLAIFHDQRHCILRKTIEGYLDSVPFLTFNTIKTLLIMHAFHSSRHLQSKWMLYFSHVSMVQVQY